MKKLNHALTRSKVLWISLIAITSGCAGAPKFPEVRLWETAMYMNEGQPVWVCGEYRIVDAQRKTYEFVADHPLESCIGVFGFKKKDLPTLFNYADDLETFYRNKCGK